MNQKRIFILFSVAGLLLLFSTFGASTFAGGSGTSSDPYQIDNCTQLQNMNTNLTASYELISNIDCSGTNTWNELASEVTSELPSSDISAGTTVDTPYYFNSIVNVTDWDGIVSYTVIDSNTLKIDEDISGILSATYNPQSGQYRGFDPIGDTSNNFDGSLDGQGYTVDKLYVNRGAEDYDGLIGYLSSEVKNIGVTDVNIIGDENTGGLSGYTNGVINNSYSTGSVSGNTYVGGLVGNNYGTVQHSYSTVNTTGEKNTGGLSGYTNGTINQTYSTGNVTGVDITGGLVGYINNGNISKSYSTGSVNGTTNVGGFVGDSGGTIKYSYSTGSVNGTTNVGGFLGANYGNIIDTYWDTESSNMSTGIGGGNSGDVTGLTTSEMTGSSATTNMSGFNFTDIWETVLESDPYTTADGYPILQNLNKYNQLMSQDLIFAGGSGTSSDPYQISTCQHLQNMNTNLNANYELINDINCSGTNTWNSGAGFDPIGNNTVWFNGSLDGQGYIVDKLYINRPTYRVGLVAKMNSSGEVKNIGLTNVDIIGNTHTGGIVGRNEGGTVDQSYVTGNITGEQNIGGIIGDNENNGVINNSYSIATVSGDDKVGGLVGLTDSNSIINNSYSTGSVSGNTNVGGLVGFAYYPTISDCYWDTENSGQSNSVGDLTGSADVTGLTTSEMTGSSATTNMSGFNFTDIWETVLESDPYAYFDGYPILQTLDRATQIDIQPAYLKVPTGDLSGNDVTYPNLVSISFSESNQEDSDVVYELYKNNTYITSLSDGQTFDKNLEVGTYKYLINTTGGANWTSNSSMDTTTVTVSKGIPSINVIFNSTVGSYTYTYPEIVNAEGKLDTTSIQGDSDVTYKFWRDGKLIASDTNLDYSLNETKRLSAGTYTYTINTTEGANWTSNSNTGTATVDKGTPLGSLTNNESWTEIYPTTVDIGYSESNIRDSDVSYNIWRDNVSKGSGESVLLGAGTYNYKLNNTAGDNWSSTSIATNTLEISKGSTVTDLKLDGSDSDISVNLGDNVNMSAYLNVDYTVCLDMPTGWGNNFECGTGSVTNITNTSNLGVGTYNITAHFDGNNNYTQSNQTYQLEVIETGVPTYSNLKESPSSIADYVEGQTYSFNATWTDNIAVDTVNFTFDGTEYTKSTTPAVKSISDEYYIQDVATDLASGDYSYEWWSNDTSGNNDSVSKTYTVQKAWNQTTNMIADASYIYDKSTLGVPLPKTELAREQNKDKTTQAGGPAFAQIPINITNNGSYHVGYGTTFSDIYTELSSCPSGWTCNKTNWTISSLSDGNINQTPATMYQYDIITKSVSKHRILNNSITVDKKVWSSYNVTGQNIGSIPYDNVWVKGDIPYPNVYGNITPYTFYDNLTSGESYNHSINISGIPVAETSTSFTKVPSGDYTKYTFSFDLEVYDGNVSSHNIKEKIPLSSLTDFTNRDPDSDSYEVEGKSTGVEKTVGSDNVILNITTNYGSSSLDEGSYTGSFTYYVPSEETGGGGGGGGVTYNLAFEPEELRVNVTEDIPCATGTFNVTWTGEQTTGGVFVSEGLRNVTIAPEDGSNVLLKQGVTKVAYKFCMPGKLSQDTKVRLNTWTGEIKISAGGLTSSLPVTVKEVKKKEIEKPEKKPGKPPFIKVLAIAILFGGVIYLILPKRD